MNIDIDAGIITDALKFAACSKTATSKPLIPSIQLSIDDKKLYISGMEPSGMLQSAIVIKRENINLVSGENLKIGTDVERILKVLNSLNGNVNISFDGEKIQITGDGKYYSENLPTDITEPVIETRFRDGVVPLPVLLIDDDGETKELTFDAVLKINNKPKIPVSFSVESISIVIEDNKAFVSVSDEISEYKDVITNEVKWNTDNNKLDITLNNNILKTVFSLLESDTVMFVHSRCVYVLINTDWGYVGYIMPAWGSV